MDGLKAPSLQSLLESGSNDSLSIQLEVEDLDDVEYAIPPTGELPTLESVLSEFDADSDIASELGVPLPVPAPTPTPSIADDGGGGVRCGGAGGGSIMRYSTLQGISAQVSSAADRVNSGLATACAVSALIAVGTSHGHILNFDVTQTMRWAHQDKHGQGAVSALAYNSDCSRLLAGYARGLILMLDTHSGDVLRHLFDAVTPNAGVLHVKWTSRPALALAADSGGSVWSLTFTRKLGIRGCTSRCLFSGARGEVCAVEPLIMDGGYNHSSGGGGTGHAGGGGGGSSSQHELDPYCIVALATLSKYFIVMVRPRLRVVKYHALQGPADCLPLLAWQMVLIQAADTSRSVDPVLVVGRGTQLFFHQLFVANGRITLLYLRHVQLSANLLSAHWLGPKCVGCMDTSEILHLIDVRSSRELECIDLANAGLVYGSAHFKALATGGHVSPALALAGTHACYSSIASRGSQLYVLGARSLHMIGVRTWTERIGYLVKNQRWQEACDIALEGYHASSDRPKRRAQAKERIIMLFREYLSTASARAPDYCLGAIMNSLIAIGEIELLWSQLWERLPSTSHAAFLQHISEHIEQERIRSVNPVISQALVEYWLAVAPSHLEQLILKLDWSCLDLNQVLKAIRHHRLYRAQIYLNTHALSDYTVSLTDLIPLLATAGDSQAPPSPEQADLGNCLLVYISSCLAGRSYPRGDIAPALVAQVKHAVLRCLTAPHSTQYPAGELPYPYLRTLLQFDTRETLNVLALAFQEREFSGEFGHSHRKRIIDILLEIMTPEDATWAQIGCLLNFIAQQISQQCLPCDQQLLEKILNHLAQEHIAHETVRQHAEREGAWHELLAKNCLAEVTNDEEQLRLAKRARCFYVAEYLLERLQRYEAILECYLANEARHETMFAYMERYAHQPERRIYEQLRQHVRPLLAINAAEVARLMDLHFRDHFEDLVETLASDGDGQEDDKGLSLFTFLEHMHRRRAALPSQQAELLLQLLCQRTPSAVLKFLETNDAYGLDRAIEIVEQEQKALPASGGDCLVLAGIYLNERAGNYQRAFELCMDLLRGAVENAEEATAAAQRVCAFCERLPVTVERAEFWFELLRCVLPRDDLRPITKSTLHAASQHVHLPDLLQLIVNQRHVSGRFGDIKDLVLSMLTTARHCTRAEETLARILAADLHEQLREARRKARRGLLVTVLRCSVCDGRLGNPVDGGDQDGVLLLPPCGHALHEQCARQYERDVRGAQAEAVHRQRRERPDVVGGGGGEDPEGDGEDVIPFRCWRCQCELRPTVLQESPLRLPRPALAAALVKREEPNTLPLKAPSRWS